jgi:MFS family permease
MTVTGEARLGTLFRLVLTSSAVSTLGDGVRFAALPLLAAVLLPDPFQIAAVTAMTTVPWLLLGLPMGAYADRVDRASMMITADVLRAVTLVALVTLLLGDVLGLAGLLVAAFTLGVGEVMFDCASFAVLPAIVAKERLELANGRLFTVQTICRDLAGYLIGGVLFTVSRAAPLVVDGISFAASALLLARLPAQRTAGQEQTASLRADVAEGVRHILRDRLLLTLTLAGGLINAVYLGQVAILVLLVRHVLGLGPVGYAAVLVAGGLGGALGGLVADQVAARLGRTITLVAGIALVGLAGIGAALATVSTTFAGYFAMGFGLMLWNVVAVSLRQSLVPAELLGRTMGAYRLVAWGTMPLGAVAFGVMATAFGTPDTFGVGGALMLLFSIVLAVVLRREPRLIGKARGW